MVELVKEYLMSNGFKQINQESKFKKFISELNNEDVFISEHENEIYIVKGGDTPFSLEEVNRYISMIAGFTLLFPNLSISYNVNLVLVCPLIVDEYGSKYLNLNNRLIFERDKYYCRKFILNSKVSKFEDELDILPIKPISIQVKTNIKGYEGLNQNVINLLGESIYIELSKKEKPNLFKLLELIEVE